MKHTAHDRMTGQNVLGDAFKQILERLEKKFGLKSKPLTKDRNILLHQPYELRCPDGHYVLKLDMKLDIYYNGYNEKHFSVMVDISGYSMDWNYSFSLPTTAEMDGDLRYYYMPKIRFERYSKSMKTFKKQNPVNRLLQDFNKALSGGELESMIEELTVSSDYARVKQKTVREMESYGFEMNHTFMNRFRISPGFEVDINGTYIAIHRGSIKCSPKGLEALKVLKEAIDNP